MVSHQAGGAPSRIAAGGAGLHPPGDSGAAQETPGAGGGNHCQVLLDLPLGSESIFTCQFRFDILCFFK